MSDREYLYGRNAVREALRADRRRLYNLFLAIGQQPAPILEEIQHLARAADVRVRHVDKAQLDKMTGPGRHQGVLAETSAYPYLVMTDLIHRLRETSVDQPPLVLVLDYVQDPQNLGTLIRTADAVEVDGIVIPRRRAAGVTPAVVNASAGASEHVCIVAAKNLVRAIEELKQNNLWIFGLEQHADASLHIETDLSGPLGLVVGSEGKGMSRLVREACDMFIQLPMGGRVTSLNAAVAGSVALYEVWRQRDVRRRESGGERFDIPGNKVYTS